MIAVLLMLPLVPGCRTTPTEPEPDFPAGLPPIMKDLRIAGRDLKRAIILEDETRFAPLGNTLLAMARRLESLESPPDFAEKSRTLIDRAEALTVALDEALPEADMARIDTFFGKLVDGCITCHRIYRDRE